MACESTNRRAVGETGLEKLRHGGTKTNLSQEDMRVAITRFENSSSMLMIVGSLRTEQAMRSAGSVSCNVRSGLPIVSTAARLLNTPDRFPSLRSAYILDTNGDSEEYRLQHYKADKSQCQFRGAESRPAASVPPSRAG